MLDTPHIPEKYIKDLLVKAPMVRLGVLHMLSKKAMCGNEIAKAIQKEGPPRPEGQHKKLNPNVLYPLLHKLEHEGFISGEWDDELKRSRRYYTITAKGRIMLKQLKATLKPMIMATLETMHKLVKELFGEEL